MIKKLSHQERVAQLCASIGDGPEWSYARESSVRGDLIRVLLDFIAEGRFKALYFDKMLQQVLERSQDIGAWSECQSCGAKVDESDAKAYFSSPCGTFCGECMAAHMAGCGVCRDEFQ